jgi:hypothetical protein
VATRDRPEFITVRGRSFESLALPQPLKFRPPLVEVARNPDGFSYYWQLLTYVFDLPSPYDFPPLPDWTDEELSTLTRFATVARRIAAGEVVSGKYQVTVSVDQQDGQQRARHVRDLPSDELMAGFAVSFRQLYSDDEPASWQKVRNLLGRRSHEARDEHTDQRLEWLARWRRAHGRLLATDLKGLVRQTLEERGRWAGPDSGGAVSPTLVISQFQYGDLIHWGRHAAFLDKLAQDPIGEALMIMRFLEACGGLCHLYFGMAVMIEAATRGVAHRSAEREG